MLKCSCPPEWTGEYCETAVVPCQDRCQNGGRCVQSAASGAASCQCPTGFVGQFCENCPALDCLNGAFCRAVDAAVQPPPSAAADPAAGYVCSCPPGYWGQRCQHSECDNYCLQVCRSS